MVKESPATASGSPVRASTDGNGHAEVIDQAIADNRHLAGALLPILHAIQDRLGFIPPDAARRLAEALNLSHADVQRRDQLLSRLSRAPPGRHVLKLCRAEACQAMGAGALEARLKASARDRLRRRPRPMARSRWSRCIASATALLSPAVHDRRSAQGARDTAERLDALVASLEEAMTDEAAFSGADPRANGLRASRFGGALGGRRRSRASHRACGAQGRARRRQHRAQRLARHVLARAPGRSGHAPGSRSRTGR